MTHRKIGFVFGAASAAILSMASGAPAATAPLRATTDEGGAQRALKSHVVGYTLSSAWTRYTYISGNPSTYSYYRDVPAGDIVCRVLLTASGQLTKARPSVGSSSVSRAGHTFAIDRRGRSDSLRWYLGTITGRSSAEGVAAMGYERAPSDVRSAARKYVVFDMDVRVESPSAACDEAPSKYTETLARAIRTAEVRKDHRN